MQRSPLKIILFIAFVDLTGFGLIIPLQAAYAERLGASGFTFGLLVGIYALMQLIFNPLLGRWSDRVGRRRVLLLSMAGSVVSHALLGFADLSNSLVLLFIARALDGVTGANVATAQAYIADITTSENRARGMGLFGAAFGSGFVVGPALGAGLAAIGRVLSGPTSGTAWPAFGGAVIAAVAVFFVWRLLPESRPRTDATRRRFEPLTFSRLRAVHYNHRLRELFGLNFAAIFAFVLLEATFVYLCVRRFGVTETGTGLLFAYVGVMMVIVQGGLVGRLVRKFGEMRLIIVAPVLTAIGFVLLSLVPITSATPLAWALLMVGCIPTTVGHGLTGPNLNSLISRQTADDRQGATLGLSQGIGSLARAVAPPIGGLAYDLGPSWPYWAGAVILVVIAFLAYLVRPAQERAIQAIGRAGL
ncbi:MAG: MFS transporter [Phycisphaerae bacterium]|jgi:DHA1 family tetracycline resistance protein-like MFS transporter